MFMRGYLYFYLLDFTIRLENIFFFRDEHYACTLFSYFDNIFSIKWKLIKIWFPWRLEKNNYANNNLIRLQKNCAQHRYRLISGKVVNFSHASVMQSWRKISNRCMPRISSFVNGEIKNFWRKLDLTKRL